MGGDGRRDGEEGGALPTPDMMKIFKLLADAKIGAVTEWLEASLLSDGAGDPSRKVLIFAHHRSVHSAIAEFLQKRLQPSEWIHITGATPLAERSHRLGTFQQEPRCRFAVLALTACGVGLNLACADTAVFAELCWNPSTLEQAEARIHRMGQKASHVNVYYLTAGEGDKSPDSAMFGALVKKSRASARVVDGGASSRNDLGNVLIATPVPRRVDVAEEQARGARMQALPGECAASGSDGHNTARDVHGKRRARDEPPASSPERPTPTRRRLEKAAALAGSSADLPVELSDEEDEAARPVRAPEETAWSSAPRQQGGHACSLGGLERRCDRSGLVRGRGGARSQRYRRVSS